MKHDMHPQDLVAASGGIEALLPAGAPLVCAGVYLYLVRRARSRNPVRGWSHWRTASFTAGLTLLATALLPPIASMAHHDFRGHMVQHLIIGMYAPLALVLGAPVTLLLRVLPAFHGRRVASILHSRVARLLTYPAVALILSTGSLAALYFTPLYDATMSQPIWHWLWHAHFLLSGCLFAYVIAGSDPAPARPSVRVRLVYLGCAIAAHSLISQLMYAGLWINIRAPVLEVKGGAEIMYYGGDIAELLLAAALVTTWHPDRNRRQQPDKRRSGAINRRAEVPGTPLVGGKGDRQGGDWTWT